MSEPLRLVQRSIFLPTLSVEATADGRLVLSSSGLFRSWSQTYSLDEIDPTPIHERAFAAGWAVGAAAAVLVWVFAIWAAMKEGGTPAGLWFTFGFLSLIAFALTLNAVRLSPNIYAYRSSRAHAVLFALRRNSPSGAAVDSFVSSLAKLIGTYRNPPGLTTAQLAEHHRKALQYLLENQVLSQSEVDTALKRLEEKHKSGVVLELIKK